MKRETHSCLPTLCYTFHSDTFYIAVLDSRGCPTECSNIQHLHLNLIISLLEVYKELMPCFVLVPFFLKYLILWIVCMSFGLQIFVTAQRHCTIRCTPTVTAHRHSTIRCTPTVTAHRHCTICCTPTVTAHSHCIICCTAYRVNKYIVITLKHWTFLWF